MPLIEYRQHLQLWASTPPFYFWTHTNNLVNNVCVQLLLSYFLEKIGPEATKELKDRVASGIKTTFASSYTKVVSLVEALQKDAIAVYGKQATGEKYLINPNK